jgi:RNA recognition motif-containing protein
MNGKPKGIAYVEFESDQVAADALTANGTKIRGL